MSYEPDLSILPPEQQALWPLLESVPPHFVLYGGTALALRLGHRRSVGFDFMSAFLREKATKVGAIADVSRVSTSLAPTAAE